MAPDMLTLSLPPLLFVLALSCATHGANAAACDPTSGFITVPLADAQLPVQRPYDVPLDQRYVFVNGMRRLWVYCNDKPHSPTSHTMPRTEIRMQNYSSGVWQFEAYVYVPSGTTGACIMQLFGAAAPQATTLMLRVYGSALVYFHDWTRVVDGGIYHWWFRLNVIHDVGAGLLTVFIDGEERLSVAGRGGDFFYSLRPTNNMGRREYFKFGVYAQTEPSHLMESRWRDVKLFTKPAY